MARRKPHPTPTKGSLRIWLTGATSGIGAALARHLLAEGHRVALSARREEALQAVAGDAGNALLVPVDVTRRDAMAEAAQRIDTAFDGLDMVILNAGTCEYLEGGRVDAALVERVFAANLFGAVNGIEAALPLLHRAREQGSRPLLAATSSASAFFAMPRAEAYGASKAALSYFMESLRLDLAHQGIDVSVIHPGFVKTPMTERNDFPMPMAVSAEKAATLIIEGLAARRRDIHFPRRLTWVIKLLGALPLSARTAIGKRLVRRHDSADRNTPEPRQ